MSVGSSLFSDAEGYARWPFPTKKSRYLLRRSFRYSMPSVTPPPPGPRASSIPTRTLRSGRPGGARRPASRAGADPDRARSSGAPRPVPLPAPRPVPLAAPPASGRGIFRAMTDDDAAPTPTNGRLTLLVAAVAFLALGGLVSLYGPLFPALRARFDVGVEQVGAVVSAHFFGSLAAVLAAGEAIRRWGYRAVLTLGAALLTAGLAGLAPAPSWPVFLVSACLAGVGFGATQVAVNLLVARTFMGRATPALNLINAVFGAGAVLTPVIVAASAPRPEPPMWVLTGLSALVLVAVRSLLRAVPRPPRRPGAGEPVAWGALAAFVLLYF